MVLTVVIQVSMTMVPIMGSPWTGVVEVLGASGSRRVARCVITYVMSTTLLTSHALMFWLKAYANANILLYADTQQREGGRAQTPSGRGTRQGCGVRSREWIGRWRCVYD